LIEGEHHTNNRDLSTTAVTWGVFRDRQVIQPTVVDPESFGVWAKEAFLCWTTWIDLYETDSPARGSSN
jgi:methylenetetrahydrofolate reductase (NADPH)